jgi:four helix bundle protein
MKILCATASTFRGDAGLPQPRGLARGPQLAVRVHVLTAGIPRTNNAEVVGQIRRAALSIPANIAEGCGRSTDRDFAKFLQIAFASANELEYHLKFVSEIGLVHSPEFELEEWRSEIIEVRRMLTGLLRKLRTREG